MLLLSEIKLKAINLRFKSNRIFRLIIYSYSYTANYNKPRWKSQIHASIYKRAQYRASCKEGPMPVLDSWYRADGWRGTGIVQPQS